MNNLSLIDGYSSSIGDQYNWQPYYPLIQQYYPVYIPYWDNQSKIEQAYLIAQKLIDKKLVKQVVTIKDFIELVNEIVTIL